MEYPHSRSEEIQNSLSALTLVSNPDDAVIQTKIFFLGKVISTSVFGRFVLIEVIKRVWKLHTHVQIEGVKENIFKFTFKEKRDKDRIFRGRPWTLDEAHLILKEWKVDLALSEVSFETSTFFLQVHNRLPSLLNQGNALKIGNQIGLVHEDSITRKSVVATKFLRFRVDILGWRIHSLLIFSKPRKVERRTGYSLNIKDY